MLTRRSSATRSGLSSVVSAASYAGMPPSECSPRPLFDAARDAGETREGLTLEQALEAVVAVARIEGDAEFLEPILAALLDGLLGRAGAG